MLHLAQNKMLSKGDKDFMLYWLFYNISLKVVLTFCLTAGINRIGMEIYTQTTL